MAKKDKEIVDQKNKKSSRDKKENKPRKPEQSGRFSDGTMHSVFAVIAFALALFFTLSAFHGAGPAGNFFYSIFSALFGYGYILVPMLCLLLGVSFIQSVRPDVGLAHTISSALFLISSLGLIDIASSTQHHGGAIGMIAAYPFMKLFGTYVSIIFLGGILIISLIMLLDARPNLLAFFQSVREFFQKNPGEKKVRITGADEEEIPEKESEEIVPEEKEEKPKKSIPASIPKPADEDELAGFVRQSKVSGSYVYPPLSLLEKDKGKPDVGDVKANLNVIKRTLMNFGIEVEMDEVTIGPTVTRYALKPAEGVKLSRIVGLQNDLALALAAHPIRIEAPIPGKSLVGIEIPNRAKSIVGLATLLADDKFQGSQKPLMVALGRNISGKSVFGNLAKMPHALIAGATGSGKSVTIHSIITSLLYRNSPEDLRLIMVDPKRVELTLYNKIPHLLTPVITDPKKAILALKWAAKEMDRRYDIFEAESVRDIESYHSNIFGKNKKQKGKGQVETDTDAERMPYIVIIIDELADIMQSYPRELESAIVRLAQMSRAVGIHLILSTQRPSVNVITGLIKANVPARVALQVSSQIDSRTILDQGGAEKLLGAGDMLYSSGDMASPERIQSAFISEDEVKKVVKFLANNAKEDLPNEINLTGGSIGADKSIFEASMDEDADDDLYEEARQTVIEAGKASTSFLQRKLGVGYARAARLVDMLEERGVVGAGNGAKPREVLEKSVDAERAEFPTE